MSTKIYRVQIVFAARTPEEADNVRNWVEGTLKTALHQLPADNRIELPLVGKPTELF